MSPAEQCAQALGATSVPADAVFNQLPSSCAQGTMTQDQKDNAKELLRIALKQQHSSKDLADKAIRAISLAVVDLGLSSTTSTTFKLQHVRFTLLGPQIQNFRQQNSLKATSIIDLIRRLSLQRYFTWTDLHSEKLLTANLAELLPDASPSIRSLLPNIPWKTLPAQPRSCTLKRTHVSNVQCNMPDSRETALSAQETKRLRVQEPVHSTLPLAAGVFDVGPQQPGLQTWQLYIVQVLKCTPFIALNMHHIDGAHAVHSIVKQLTLQVYLFTDTKNISIRNAQ